MKTAANTIVYPTDFSVCAENALDYAVGMAKALGCSIKTVHFLDMSETVHHDDNPIRVMKELELMEVKTARRLKTRNREIIEKGIDCQHQILTQDRFSWLTNYVDEQNPDMVVMGTQGTNIAENKIFGSETYKVVKNCNVPALVVPEIATYRVLKNIVFAADYKTNDIKSLEFVVKIAKHFNASINVIHISEKDFDESIYLSKMNDLKDDIFSRTGHENIEFNLLHASNVAKRLEIFLKESNAYLLAMVARKLGFFERLFGKSLTKRMVYHTNTPMLIF